MTTQVMINRRKLINTNTNIPAEQYSIYTRAANQFIESTKSGLSFYLKFRISLLIASIVSIIIIVYLLVTSSMLKKLTELLGTGTIELLKKSRDQSSLSEYQKWL